MGTGKPCRGAPSGSKSTPSMAIVSRRRTFSLSLPAPLSRATLRNVVAVTWSPSRMRL